MTEHLKIVPIRRALLSVSDKKGLVPFCQFLAAKGVELISTGGTAKSLRAAGLTVRDVSDLTGFPECFDGRLKTLDPHVHGPILFRRNDPAHVATAATLEMRPIDLIVVNFYPFEDEVAKDGVTWEQAIEKIDIGGPTMVRAAAKNHEHVTVLAHPNQYDLVRDQMNTLKGTTLTLRTALAQEVFRITHAYEGAILAYMEREYGRRTTHETIEGNPN